MASKRILLDLAAFLDSEASVRVVAPDRAGQRTILEGYLTGCYDELGAAPRLVDGDGMRSLLRELLPRRFTPGDPLAEFVPDLLSAYLDFLEATGAVPFAFEMRQALLESEGAFLEAVATGDAARHLAAPPSKPFVHGASKLGRNDPCSCGSGKKFKHCHGK